MPSMPCHECGKTRRCKMYLDERDHNRPIYLCAGCARDLGYAERGKEKANG